MTISLVIICLGPQNRGVWRFGEVREATTTAGDETRRRLRDVSACKLLHIPHSALNVIPFQNTPMHQLVLKLTGKAPAGGNADYDGNEHSFEFQPGEDNRSVDKNIMMRDSEFQFIAPVSVRLLQAFYDGRYQCTVKPDRATWSDWVKLKRPLIPNVIRWRKYYSDTPDMISASRVNSQFHVQVSPRNPPGWLGSKPSMSSPASGSGPVDRRPTDVVEGPELYWGIVGKIQASSSHGDNRRINDARADGVTVLPCRCRNRVAMVMLMAFLPFRHGLAAKVRGISVSVS